jgi:cyanate lyase
MPISLSTSVRRALGLGAAAVAAAIAIWILSDNINKKKKKKEIEFPDIIEEQQQFVQVSEEMEVLVSAAVEELHTSPKEEMEALIEVLEIDEEKAPVSRSWTDLVEEELEADANQLEQSLSSQLPKSQPQIVVSLFSYFYIFI